MNEPRDLIGYGQTPPDPAWPGGAVLAVQFVPDYEEGGERSILYRDAESEAHLSDGQSEPRLGARNMTRRACTNTPAAPASGGSGACLAQAG